uniref:NADH-ubiquinone oxidoreductase chain 6 n=1 Tax=Nemoptera coa TaxID=560912 RepID=A0A1S5QYE5_9NEOP|nr:NADH dehydrogenase subunit 6 [Nemoptera coa]
MFLLNSMNIILSMNFINTKHPLAMGLILLIQTIIVSMTCGLYSYSYWFSYILFLIMLGGMLVLFIYMTSLASNELFSISTNWTILSLILLIASSMMMFLFDQTMVIYNNYEMTMLNNNLMFHENENPLIKLYNNPTMNITIMMMNYLLLTLIIIVKITKINYGPLRQMF